MMKVKCQPFYPPHLFDLLHPQIRDGVYLPLDLLVLVEGREEEHGGLPEHVDQQPEALGAGGGRGGGDHRLLTATHAPLGHVQRRTEQQPETAVVRHRPWRPQGISALKTRHRLMKSESISILKVA
jgi:hypothetical protein